MCGSGLSVSRPARRAVGSPRRSATQPCATSWTVTARSSAGDHEEEHLHGPRRIADEVVDHSSSCVPSGRGRGRKRQRSARHAEGPVQPAAEVDHPARGRAEGPRGIARPRDGTVTRRAARAGRPPASLVGHGLIVAMAPAPRQGPSGAARAGPAEWALLYCSPVYGRSVRHPFASGDLYMNAMCCSSGRRLAAPLLALCLLAVLLAPLAAPIPGFAQTAAPATPAAAPHAGGGEASLRMPDVGSIALMGVNGRTLLLGGLVVCVLGLVFGLVIFRRIKNLPVHAVHAGDLGADLRDVQDVPRDAGQVPPDPRDLHRAHHRSLLRRPAPVRARCAS